MVLYFNRKDLVTFGNYLLSQERMKRISKENKDKITRADIENWMQSLKKEE